MNTLKPAASLILFTLLTVFYSSVAKAQTASQCVRTHTSVLEDLRTTTNRLAFGNQGGLFNGGTCWWHSRLERSAAYLAAFKPDEPRPSDKKLRQLLRDLTFMRPVVIPGYESLEDLSISLNNEAIVQKVLNAWQVRDGFINQAWVKGLKGRVHMKADKLKLHMDQIYKTFKASPRPYFLMLQLPAVVAHAYLLLGIKATDYGYLLEVADSNSPGKIIKQKYEVGTTALNYYGDDFIPYLGFARDYQRMEKNLSKLCF